VQRLTIPGAVTPFPNASSWCGACTSFLWEGEVSDFTVTCKHHVSQCTTEIRGLCGASLCVQVDWHKITLDLMERKKFRYLSLLTHPVELHTTQLKLANHYAVTN